MVRFKDPYTQKYKEKSRRGFKSKKEAQLAAAEEEKKLLKVQSYLVLLQNLYLNTFSCSI
ncbi:MULTISPECIES: Arm DNA-binding domain-containing protein [unclassified Bacillus (in: firmicutes)]|uniref:Arm DNA-binding domain-containing protein n=1 Tax=unclassified Bacillus (in: firmicutes) TaxID=185979 RepID=UPI001F5BDC05|nr:MULTISPECIES: Arm DNA-binding domain-containing protein [unclassified Bacillus (in: firmicutes)]